jgi:hypothetical protein
MVILREFSEFIEKKIVERRTPNLFGADSLVKESEKKRRFLDTLAQKIGVSNENANQFIEISYDTLIGLIRGKMFIEGYYSKGEGAHEAEVSFMKHLGFDEDDVRFMNDLRYFRNGILYYGKQFDKDYEKK